MKKFYDVFASRQLMVVLLVVYAVLLGVATFIENSKGTPFARQIIYNNILFFVLELCLAVNFVAISMKLHLFKRKKWGLLLLHYGFVIILMGALVTHLFSVEGLVHVREGETSNQLLDTSGKPLATLPFDITLDDFVLEKYSGSGSPSSYESFLTIDRKQYHAYMNNVVYIGQYRIYQSSYDSDLMGSVLTVNRDLAGMIITYLGYFLLFLGMILSLLDKDSRFRKLASSIGLVALIGVLNANAQAPSEQKNIANKIAVQYSINKDVAENFSRLMVQTHAGRIEPIDTYSRELLRKFHRNVSYSDLNSNQVLLGLISQPEVWSRVDILKIGDESVAKLLGATCNYVSFIDIVDSLGVYKLQKQVNEAFAKSPNQRNKFDKEIIKLDEKVNIMYALFEGRMLQIFPLEGDRDHHWFSAKDDLSQFNGKDSMFVGNIMNWLVESLQNGAANGNWTESNNVIDMIDTYQMKKSNNDLYSETRIKAELLYNKLDIFKWSGFGFMFIGMLMMIVIVVSEVSQKSLRKYFYGLIIGSILIFLFQNFGMGLRWYISQRAPWTNSYESMVYIGWAAILGGFLFLKRSKMVFSLAVFMGGAILFVSNLSFMDPQITPLVPVLKSYWLIIHVAVITASYGFFALGFLLGVSALILITVNSQKLQTQIKELVTANELVLWLGLVLMTTGTFLGAVWANQSWGRYWGWDPKETWALITMVIYAIVLHVKLRSNLIGWWTFSVMSIIALGSVLMTFFGVNYYLNGLHSYGSDSAPTALNIIWYSYFALACLAVIAYLRIRSTTKN